MPRIMVATCFTATNGKRGSLSSCSWGGEPNPHRLDTAPRVRSEADAPHTCWKVLLRNRAEQLAGGIGFGALMGAPQGWTMELRHPSSWNTTFGDALCSEWQAHNDDRCLESLPTQPHEHCLSKSIPGGRYAHPSESPTSRTPCRADEKIISTSQSQVGFAPQKDTRPT